ncbi:hypothetical protein ACFTWF_22490 [Rhodococcus sp. NPDC056960]|uniref:hypothetical protein n=1 Tax=Rhodococcus sp. NPDC056960 TaxID=3345982 RepID=UPI00363015CF
MTLHVNDIHTDDERDAWRLHEDGHSWTQVARELGCTEGAARALAASYRQRTDAAANENQEALF